MYLRYHCHDLSLSLARSLAPSPAISQRREWKNGPNKREEVAMGSGENEKASSRVSIFGLGHGPLSIDHGLGFERGRSMYPGHHSTPLNSTTVLSLYN
jgi:hypothetical protein